MRLSRCCDWYVPFRLPDLHGCLPLLPQAQLTRFMHIQREHIRINCVNPGIVPTKISPQDLLDAVPEDW